MHRAGLILAERMDSNELKSRVDCVSLSQDKYGKGNIEGR